MKKYIGLIILAIIFGISFASAQTTTGTPSANQSQLTVDKTCVLPDNTDIAIVTLTIADQNGTILTDPTLKPTIAASPATGITAAVKQSSSGIWSIGIKSSAEREATLRFKSNNILVGTQDISFATTCASTAATETITDQPADSTIGTTTDTTLPTDTSTTTEPETTTTPTATSNLSFSKLLPIIVAVALIGLLGFGAFQWIKRRRQAQTPEI